ncbi:MAG: pantetheine-phosphate adenylyltransferase [Candidatus Hadarchaeales archaeon]
MKYKNVAVGGTFDYFHDGHRALISRAYEIGERVVLGLCSDRMQELLRKDSAGVRPLPVRALDVLKFISENGWLERTELTILEDAFGPAVARPEIDAIVVSPGTRATAEEINRKRIERGMKPLDIVEVPYVLAQDGTPISSIRIRYGEMDVHGRIKNFMVT